MISESVCRQANAAGRYCPKAMTHYANSNVSEALIYRSISSTLSFPYGDRGGNDGKKHTNREERKDGRGGGSAGG